MIAMILAAVLTPASVPDNISSDEVEQSLDLSGTWEGTLNEHWRARLDNGKITAEHRPGSGLYRLYAEQIIDEGAGKLRTKLHNTTYLGIYLQEGDRLIICEQHWSYGRPIHFRWDGRQSLLILRRVSPPK